MPQPLVPQTHVQITEVFEQNPRQGQANPAPIVDTNVQETHAEVQNQRSPTTGGQDLLQQEGLLVPQPQVVPQLV